MQYTKACVYRDYVVLKSKQVEVLEVLKVSRQRLFCVVPYMLAMARVCVIMYQLLNHKRGRIAPEAELSVVVSLMVDQVSSLHSRGIFDALLVELRG